MRCSAKNYGEEDIPNSSCSILPAVLVTSNISHWNPRCCHVRAPQKYSSLKTVAKLPVSHWMRENCCSWGTLSSIWIKTNNRGEVRFVRYSIFNFVSKRFVLWAAQSPNQLETQEDGISTLISTKHSINLCLLAQLLLQLQFLSARSEKRQMGRIVKYDGLFNFAFMLLFFKATTMVFIRNTHFQWIKDKNVKKLTSVNLHVLFRAPLCAHKYLDMF